VEAALALTNGNLSQAAKLLGVHRTTLYSRMQNYMSGQSIDTNSSER
jgi:transcriptional regulator of acetoin/glycerol metabolism